MKRFADARKILRFVVLLRESGTVPVNWFDDNSRSLQWRKGVPNQIIAPRTRLTT